QGREAVPSHDPAAEQVSASHGRHADAAPGYRSAASSRPGFQCEAAGGAAGGAETVGGGFAALMLPMCVSRSSGLLAYESMSHAASGASAESTRSRPRARG